MADETTPFPNSNRPDHTFEQEPALGATSSLFETQTAAERLRAFENEHLGEDAPRQSGQVEKGHGSLFQRLSPEHRKAHAAIEKTAETEDKLNAARAALAQAEADHAVACKAAEDASRFGG